MTLAEFEAKGFKITQNKNLTEEQKNKQLKKLFNIN